MEEDQRKTIIKETFNTVSGEYDNKALQFFPESAEYLASSLRLRGDEQVIDVATGTGNAALAVARYLPKGFVTGIDFSQGMLEQARKKAASMNVPNVRFLEMDMQAMDFTDARFDVAICAFGIFFVEDMDTQLTRIAGMVRDGGVVAICNFYIDYFQPLRDLLINRLVSYGVQIPPQIWKRIATEADCREFFEKAGIRNVRVEQKNMGFFLENGREWWDVVWNAGYRRMVNQLQPSDAERFKQEHLQEIAALATKDGIWLDIGVLYTIGVK
jgi:ubiquinone/menaquinone biosynthesis C-methylase UbiE